MNNPTQIVRQESASVQAAPQIPSVAQMLQTMIDRGVTGESVSALEKMVELYERMEDRNAIKDFSKAFVALQAEMPNVKAISSIPGRDGTVRSRFAPYEEIMAQVAPLLQKHGFTVRFSTDFKEGRIIKTCTLQHIGGHSVPTQFAVRIGSGPPGCSEGQADGAASSYAKRYALCDALNIVIDKDVDAAAEGDYITADQAFELARRVNETNSNREGFLKFAGAASFATIRQNRYDDCDEMLSRKERRKA